MEKRHYKAYIELTQSADENCPGFLQWFRDRDFEVCAYHGTSPNKPGLETRREMFRNCDICICCVDQIDASLMELAPDLKLISAFSSGVDNIDIKAATARRIPVTNARGGGAEAVSELTFGLMLSLARGVQAVNRDMHQSKWTKYTGMELAGKTLGLLGLGVISSQVARIAHAGFGMRILAYDVVKNLPLAQLYDVEYLPLDEVLRESDFVSIHVPLLDSTRHMINEKTLSLMKPSAFLINIARGPIVDQAALLSALQNGRIAGAGLDVYEKEPCVPNPFAGLDNVVCTAHMGSATVETAQRSADMILPNVEAILAGKQPTINLLNPEIYDIS